MLKVLHICSGNYYGGIEEVCRHVVNEQLKNNYSPEIIYFQNDFKPKIKIDNKSILKVYYLYKYIKLVRLKKFDILHNHSGGLVIDLLNLLLFSKSKLFSHNHGCRLRVYKLNQEPKLNSLVKQKIAKQIYKKIPRISVSKFIHDLQKEYEHTISKNNILLSNPINFSELSATLKFAESNNYRLGYLGRIVEYKGIKAIINFAIYQKKQGLNSRILICGPGEFSDELNKNIVQNNLEEIVTFENKYVKKNDFFQNIDIFISLPNFEPFGLTLYEAIFLGIPTITMQKESIDEKLHSFVWCLKNDTPEEIIGAIKDIKLNKDLIKTKHKGIQEYLLNNYSVENYVKSLESVYKS